MNVRQWTQTRIDRQAFEMMAVFVAVLAGTIAIALAIRPEQAAAIGPPEQLGDGAQGEATASAIWVAAEVALAVAALGSYLGYLKLSEWVKTTVRRAAVVGLIYYLFWSSSAPAITLAIVLGAYVTYRVADHYGVYWAINDLLCVALAVAMGVVLALFLGVVGVGIGLVGMLVYDHHFANRETHMFHLAAAMLRLRLPVLFVRPNEWRFQWQAIVDMTDDVAEEGEESDVGWGLGTADLGLPAAFVAAVILEPATSAFVGGLAVAGLCAAGILVACFRLRFELVERGSGAGLPALSVGVLVPYTVSMLVVMVA